MGHLGYYVTCSRDLFSNLFSPILEIFVLIFFLMILWNAIWGLSLERIGEGCVISIYKVISSPYCWSSKIKNKSKKNLENWRKYPVNTLFGWTISTHFVAVSPLFNIQPLFLQKIKPLYPHPKYLFGIGILIWATKN